MAIKAEKSIAWDQGKRQKWGEIGNISASGGLSSANYLSARFARPFFSHTPISPFSPNAEPGSSLENLQGCSLC